jgi:putative NADH-flavin reductase
MKVVVFGASGKVGSIVVEMLLKKDHQVWAFVHSSNPFKDDPNLKILKGDIYNTKDVEQAIKGVEVVISTLGSWGTKRKDVVSTGIKNIIEGMNDHKVKRLISLTGSDALAPGDSKTLASRLTHLMISLSPASKILSDGEKHIELLAASNLDWTTLRSPVMNAKGNISGYELTDKRPLPIATINRSSVAAAVVNLVEDKKYLSRAPYIVRR